MKYKRKLYISKVDELDFKDWYKYIIPKCVFNNTHLSCKIYRWFNFIYMFNIKEI